MSKRNLPMAEVAARPGVRTEVSPTALMRWNPQLRAADEANDANTISILDVIGFDWFGEGVTAKRISGALRKIGDEDVVVNINSPGGDFFEGLAIYNILREHPGAVTVKILGMAASAAAVIAMAGDDIQMAKSGFMMIHNTWVMAAGDRHELHKVADWMEPFDNTTAELFAARTGLKQSDIVTMLNDETWIGGSKAVDQGFADDFLPSDQVKSDPEDVEAKQAKSAQKQFDAICAKAGVSVSQRKDILRGIKGGTRGAATSGTHDAAFMDGISDLIETINSI